MTRDQFIDKHRPVFSGLVADAYSSDKKGAEAGIRLRLWLRQIDEELAKIYREFQPEEPAPTRNGVATPTKG
jgi:hypothetical protein